MAIAKKHSYWSLFAFVKDLILPLVSCFCFITVSSDSLSRELKIESYTFTSSVTSSVSHPMVVASIQWLWSLQKTIWSLFSLIWLVTVHGVHWNNVEWSPLMLGNCDFRILCAKFISTSVSLSPIIIASSSNFLSHFLGGEQTTSSTAILLCTTDLVELPLVWLSSHTARHFSSSSVATREKEGGDSYPLWFGLELSWLVKAFVNI